jgi:hypothetical protein
LRSVRNSSPDLILHPPAVGGAVGVIVSWAVHQTAIGRSFFGTKK